MNRHDFLRAAAASAVLLPAWAGRLSARPAAQDTLLRWRLASGLLVLCLPRRDWPLATVQMFYQVGSKHEKPGQRGAARMLETLMWKGSPRMPPDAHARFIRQVGGSVGSFTTEDVTAFHQTVPPDSVDFALELEAERQKGLALLPSIVSAERQARLGERATRVEGNPLARALELYRATVFEGHPYAFTTAGTTADLRALSVESLRAFRDKHYQPERATLVVAGAVEPEAVQAAVERHFGSEPGPAGAPGDTRARAAVPFTTPERPGERHVRVPIAVPVAIYGFLVPAAGHEDQAALDVLADLVAAGPDPLLRRAVVEEHKAALSVGGAHRVLADAGLFASFALCAPDGAAGAAHAHLRTALEGALSDAELGRRLDLARTRVGAAAMAEQSRIEGVGVALGIGELVAGDAAHQAAYLGRLASLTRDDVLRAAERHLAPTRAWSFTASPERSSASPGKASEGGR